MKLLLAPLNWGLGHASRCVPLVQRFLNEGHEVVLGGDGESLTLLRKHFPQLRYVRLAPLTLRYGAGNSQVWAMIKALPKLILWAIKDHALLQALLREEHFDRIISDNRFGLTAEGGLTAKRSYSVSGQTQSVYITHQLHILFPRGWRWLEPLAEWLHARIMRRFDEVWVPDYEDFDQSLAGELSHPNHQSAITNNQLKYIGPLSRFSYSEAVLQPKAVLQRSGLIAKGGHYDIIVVLSGLEPQRTIFERDITGRFAGKTERVLIVQGRPGAPGTTVRRGNITLVPSLGDDELAAALIGARHIIARSGYSTIMDLHALGLLHHQSHGASSRLTGGAASAEKGLNNDQSPITNHQSPITNHQLELLPTPGQPEQEYLAERMKGVES